MKSIEKLICYDFFPKRLHFAQKRLGSFRTGK